MEHNPRRTRTLLTALLLASAALSLPAVADLESARASLREAQSLSASLATAPPAEIAAIEQQATLALRAAREAFQGAGADQPGAEAYFEYLEVLHALGDHDLLADSIARATGGAPRSAREGYYLGRARLLAGPEGFRDAVLPLKRALAAAPDEGFDRPACLAQLGEAYFRAGHFEASRAVLEEALAANPDTLEAAIGLSILDARAGKIEESSARLDLLGAKVQPYDARIRVRLREALEHAESVNFRIAGTAAGHAAYGKTLYRAGRISTAILAIKRATELDPGNVTFFNLLGAMYVQTGRGPAAEEAYAHSLELQPDQPGIRQTLDALRAANPMQGQGPLKP